MYVLEDEIIKNGVVYKYVDTDGVVKYVGLVKPGNSFSKRIEQHKNDVWYHDGFSIFYITLETQTDCEYCESFFINYYKTFKYYNISKSTWGGSSFINASDFKWTLYNEQDFVNEYIKPKEGRKLNIHKAPTDLNLEIGKKRYSASFAVIPDEITLSSSLGKKRVLFTIAIQLLRNKTDVFYITMNEFVAFCGYKPDTHKSKINHEVKSFLNAINGLYIDSLELNYGNIKFTILESLSNPLRFSIINYEEYYAINDFTKSITKPLSLLVLSYIRLYMYKKHGVNDTKPEMFFDHLNNIMMKLDCLDYRSLRRIINVLDTCDIIYSCQMPRYQDKYNNWHSGITVFVDKHKYINGMDNKSYNYQKEMELAQNTIYINQFHNINK